MPRDEFPSRCPGCKQRFTKRRQWERHHCRPMRNLPPPGESEAPVTDEVDREEEEAVTASTV